jgi:phage tail-like protein
MEFRLHVKGPEGTQDFVLPVGQAILGRDPSNEVLLANPLVSRKHARFTCTESTCELVDLGSANGTSVDGDKLDPEAPVSLSDGSVITIGPFEILVEVVETAAAGEKSEAVEKPAAETPASEAAVVEQQVPPKPAGEKPAARKAAKPAEEKGEEKKVTAAKVAAAAKAAVPPPPPPSPAAVEMAQPEDSRTPPGLGMHSQRLLNYLPGIYQTDFMSRFLALFESILIPIEWNVDHFDMYLNPGTAPSSFLPWLANWYTVIFDATWSESQRRTLLKEAHLIYYRRGTRWALSRVLEIYLGKKPEISEFTIEKEPFTFVVNLPMSKANVNQELVEAIIDSSKPAHTTYKLTFS